MILSYGHPLVHSSPGTDANWVSFTIPVLEQLCIGPGLDSCRMRKP